MENLITVWDMYWPIIYDYVTRPPPILWILLAIAVIVALIPRRRARMNREEMVQRIVSDAALDMLEHLADKGVITWKEAEHEMIRMGRNYRWGDLIPKRTKEYQLNEKDIKQLKGMISARRNTRKLNGQDKPVKIPDRDNVVAMPKKTKKLSGRVSQLIARHKL